MWRRLLAPLHLACVLMSLFQPNNQKKKKESLPMLVSDMRCCCTRSARRLHQIFGSSSAFRLEKGWATGGRRYSKRSSRNNRQLLLVCAVLPLLFSHSAIRAPLMGTVWRRWGLKERERALHGTWVAVSSKALLTRARVHHRRLRSSSLRRA